MDIKQLLIGSGMAALLIVGTTSVSAFALEDDSSQKHFGKISSEVHEQVEAAIENNDYVAWVQLMSERPRFAEDNGALLTEETFEKITKAHEYKENGQFEEAQTIMDELRPEGKGFGKGHGKGMDDKFRRGDCTNQ
jgi:hypothetical protein